MRVKGALGLEAGLRRLEGMPATTPPSNYTGRADGVSISGRAARDEGMTTPGWHMSRLGPPDFWWDRGDCVLGVWERPSYRVFSGVGYGVAIEVPAGLGVKAGVKAAEDGISSYLSDVGLSTP